MTSTGICLEKRVAATRPRSPAPKPPSQTATSVTEELKLKQEARQWRRKIDDAEDEYRTERNRLRDESEEYLGNARNALNATEIRRELFTITWEVI